jgi:hypothetical protein
MPLDQITKDDVEALSFSGSASNANCTLRTLRRMLHKAEEWNLIGRVPRFRLLREQGRGLRLDDEAEHKLPVAAKACNRKPSRFELFRDIIILARDTGMRNVGRQAAGGFVTTVSDRPPRNNGGGGLVNSGIAHGATRK